MTSYGRTAIVPAPPRAQDLVDRFIQSEGDHRYLIRPFGRLGRIYEVDEDGKDRFHRRCRRNRHLEIINGAAWGVIGPFAIVLWIVSAVVGSLNLYSAVSGYPTVPAHRWKKPFIDGRRHLRWLWTIFVVSSFVAVILSAVIMILGLVSPKESPRLDYRRHHVRSGYCAEAALFSYDAGCDVPSWRM